MKNTNQQNKKFELVVSLLNKTSSILVSRAENIKKLISDNLGELSDIDAEVYLDFSKVSKTQKELYKRIVIDNMTTFLFYTHDEDRYRSDKILHLEGYLDKISMSYLAEMIADSISFSDFLNIESVSFDIHFTHSMKTTGINQL